MENKIALWGFWICIILGGFCLLRRNLLWLYFLLINLQTLGAFLLDKYAAIKEKQRIPERFLWMISAMGGTPGAFIGMFLFHHKTRKVSFYFPLILIALVQGLILILLIF